MSNEYVNTNDKKAVCEMCGNRCDVSQMELDEDEGILVCSLCHAEIASCGCSDELHVAD